MMIFLALVPQSEICEEAYKEYLQYYKFDHSMDIKKQTIFCQNYLEFLKIKQTCSECIVTSIFDREFNMIKGLKQFPEQTIQSDQTCQDVYCYAQDPLPHLSSIPKQVDLRVSGLVTSAKDQQSCGSCWAFATTAVLENSVLRDQKKSKNKIFSKNAKDLDLSDQYVLSNTFGFSNYCEGGDGVAALNFMIDNTNIWQTVETESNYPYDQFGYADEFKRQSPLKPKIKSKYYFMPFKSYDRQESPFITGTLKTPLVSLVDQQNKLNIDQVKQYLARGLVVLTTMNTETSPQSSIILASYNGQSALKGFACTGRSDHQVVIVGYGVFKGTSVWIIKNSWGSAWGNQGHAYIEMGTNAFCIERYAYAIIPKYYNPNDGVFKKKYSSPYTFSKDQPGLDNMAKLDAKTIVIIVAVFIVIILIAIAIIVVIIKVRNNGTNTKSQYKIAKKQLTQFQ